MWHERARYPWSFSALVGDLKRQILLNWRETNGSQTFCSYKRRPPGLFGNVRSESQTRIQSHLDSSPVRSALPFQCLDFHQLCFFKSRTNRICALMLALTSPKLDRGVSCRRIRSFHFLNPSWHPTANSGTFPPISGTSHVLA